MALLDRMINGLARRVALSDNWTNLLTNMGRAGLDKRVETTFLARAKLSQSTLEALWSQDALSLRIVGRRVEEMTREWVDFRIEGDKDGGDALRDEFERLQTRAKIKEAMQWARLYGGAIVLLGAEDGQDFSQPLNLASVSKLQYLQVVDRWHCQPFGIEDDSDSTAFGKPLYYRLQGGQYVHHTRALAFHGAEQPEEAYRQQRWHDSVLEPVWNTLRDFSSGLAGMSSALQDYSVTILGMDGLKGALSQGRSQVIIDRAAAAQATMSMFRMLVHDSEHEKVQRMSHNLSNMPEAIDRLLDLVSAAADEPKAILFGNAIGKVSGADNDLSIYYDRTRAKQTEIMQPALDRVARILFAAKTGPWRGQEPKGWQIRPRPLWQLTKLEQAEVQLKRLQAHKIAVEMGALTPWEVRMSEYGNDDNDTGITLDPDVTKMLELDKIPEPDPPPPTLPPPKVVPPPRLTAPAKEPDA